MQFLNEKVYTYYGEFSEQRMRIIEEAEKRLGFILMKHEVRPPEASWLSSETILTFIKSPGQLVKEVTKI